MTKGYTYLASPYSSPNKTIQEIRYKFALRATAWLMQKGFHVFSPIVHCHELAKEFALPRDAEYWKEYNFCMLERADHLHLLLVDGWEESRGMRQEIEWGVGRDMGITNMRALDDGFQCEPYVRQEV